MRRGLAGGRDIRRQRAQLGSQRVATFAQRAHPVVVTVERREPLHRALRPGQHLLDGPRVTAVLAHQPPDRGTSLLHDREPGRVGLDAGGVGREVGPGVGEQVADLTQSLGQRRERRVVRAGLLECGPGVGDQAGRVRRTVDRAGRVAEQRRVRPVGSQPQRVGVGEAILLGGQIEVLTVLRVDGGHLVEAEAQQIGLLRAFAGAGGQGGEVVLDRAQLGVAVGERRQRPGHRGSGVAIERGPLASRLKEP